MIDNERSLISGSVGLSMSRTALVTLPDIKDLSLSITDIKREMESSTELIPNVPKDDNPMNRTKSNLAISNQGKLTTSQNRYLTLLIVELKTYWTHS